MSASENNEYASEDPFFLDPPKPEKVKPEKTKGEKARDEFLQWCLYIGAGAVILACLLRIAFYILGV
jgi:hypothetical protein